MKRVVLLVFVTATWAVAPSLAAQAGSGLYLGGELGVNLAQGLDIGGSSNDRASVCDEFINALFASVEQHVGYEDYNCTGPDRGATGDWRNEFDRAEGILAGIVVGYSLREQYPDHAFLARFRIELEYFYRNSNYAQTAEVGGASGESRDKLA